MDLRVVLYREETLGDYRDLAHSYYSECIITKVLPAT